MLLLLFRHRAGICFAGEVSVSLGFLVQRGLFCAMSLISHVVSVAVPRFFIFSLFLSRGARSSNSKTMYVR